MPIHLHSIPTLFMCFIVFILCVQVKIKRSSKTPTWDAAFWRKEKEANFARKKDISQLPYLELDRTKLPFQDNAADRILDCQKEVEQIILHPMLNLHGMSNADIKLQYGVANFEFLSACDQNYVRLIRSLNTWGQTLYELADLTRSRQVLEYAVELGSDLTKTYITLAHIYAEQNEIDKVQELIRQLEDSDSLLKDSAIRELTMLIQKY
ncbi:MAG: hypothetical protein MR316_05920 [Lachnospiraceae bacterium]|nr:hypothetical protein [Lachnospiraceae bacterium]